MLINDIETFLYNKLLNQQAEMEKSDICDFPLYMCQLSKLNIN